MAAELRGLRREERAEALALWVEVFADDSGEYFGRYFDADPEVRDADCHVAVVDGHLVSAVHVCRRRLLWDGRELLCGAIANVATRAAYRRQGLSRALLRRAVAAMEADGFAFSMLLTGSPGHYAAVGWEGAPVPEWTIRMGAVPLPERPVRTLPATPIPASVPVLYDAAPLRPLHQRRPERYWEGWVSRYWRYGTEPTLLLAGAGYPRAKRVGGGDETGYAVLAAQPHRRTTRLLELRARDPAAEGGLLFAAARWAQERAHEALRLSFVPQYLKAEDLSVLGPVEQAWDEGLMLRSIALTPEEMARIRDAYTSGAARVWWADDF